MIIRKSPDEIAKMAEAGKIVARVHETMFERVKAGMSTMDLDNIAEDIIVGAGAVPSFKGYRGFPATLCTSINEQIVHGIPAKDVVFDDGDVLSIDCGAIVDGFHADSAITIIVGGEGTVDASVQRLVADTRNALWAGLAQAQHGNRLGDIGHAVESVSDGKYGVVREYVGHGIGRALHEDPSVPNYGKAGRGMKMSKGWVIAIEPMFNLGTEETIQLEDGWTVITADMEPSAHWEHTVAVTPDGPWILTAREDEPAYPLSDGVPAY